MKTLRVKKKLAVLNKEKREEHPRSNLAQNSNVPRSQQDYIIQVSEEIEARVTKKLFQEFNKKENCKLGALSRLDDFLMNLLIQYYSKTTPETSRYSYGANKGTSENETRSEHHLEAGLLLSQATENFGAEDDHDMPTGVHEETICCSPNTASGKNKKKNSTSQP